MADPTLRILATLDDPDRYVLERGVPVFVPHIRRDEDGEVEAAVSEDDLARIAHTMNEKAAEYGTLVRVTRGHTKLHKPDEQPPPEDEQPPIFGWAKNARVGVWGPAKKVGLLVDVYFRSEHHAEAMEYPFRSAEYYPETDEITGIALLRRDPELDLGLLTYDRQGRPIHASAEADMPFDDEFEEEIADEAGDELGDELADDLEDEMEAEGDAEEFSDEEVEQYARLYRYNHQVATQALEGMAEDDADRAGMEQLARCYARLAYGGEPGGSNTYVPGEEGEDEPPMDPLGDEEFEEEEEMPVEHLGRQGNRNGRAPARQYGRQPAPSRNAHQGNGHDRASHERDVRQTRLEKEVQELKRDRALLHYERQLLRLEQAGFVFDMAEELADAKDMNDQQRLRQLKKIARHYARGPVGGGLVPTEIDDVESPRRGLTARQKQAALAYQGKHGCSWEVAMEWARNNVN